MDHAQDAPTCILDLPAHLIARIGDTCDLPTRRACCRAHRHLQTVNAMHPYHSWTVDASGDFDPHRKYAAVKKFKPSLTELEVRFLATSVVTDDALDALQRLALDAEADDGVKVHVNVRSNDAMVDRLAQRVPAARYWYIKMADAWTPAVRLLRACKHDVGLLDLRQFDARLVPDAEAALDELLAAPEAAAKVRTLSISNYRRPGAAAAKFAALVQHVQCTQVDNSCGLYIGDAADLLRIATVLQQTVGVTNNGMTQNLFDELPTCLRLKQLVLHIVDAAALVTAGMVPTLAANLPPECVVGLAPSACCDPNIIAVARLLFKAGRKVELTMWQANSDTEVACTHLVRRHLEACLQRPDMDLDVREDRPRLAEHLVVSDQCPRTRQCTANDVTPAPTYASQLAALEAACPDTHLLWSALRAPDA